MRLEGTKSEARINLLMLILGQVGRGSDGELSQFDIENMYPFVSGVVNKVP